MRKLRRAQLLRGWGAAPRVTMRLHLLHRGQQGVRGRTNQARRVEQPTSTNSHSSACDEDEDEEGDEEEEEANMLPILFVHAPRMPLPCFLALHSLTYWKSFLCPCGSSNGHGEGK